ncbi:MAG: hypothetical protein PHY23_06505, partial [Oscillospiraceae bacterium]|nr:hypothetical protein [Oscillospiraceae bacterium]
MSTAKYRDYFDIDDQYFPCVDEAAIRAGVDWKKFYPHETFVRLLKDVERVLSRQEKKSIWIEGAYGTGKSHAALTLKKILDASDDDLKEYFDRYDLPQDLLKKFRGHKSGKIVTAHRYASGSIHGDRDLILAVQERIRHGLLDAKVEYKGENTLKESVIAWLNDPLNKNYFNSLLLLDEYKILFGEMNTDDILDKLRTSSEVSELITKIFKLADERGITALNINMDQLIKWIEDIIDKNELKALVLIWDEFSDYFRNNKHSLTEFQKLVSLCQFKPFYLMIVTHEAGHLFHEGDKDGKRILDRYLRSEITMPENIAFDLIAAALVKRSAAQDDWERKSDDLNSRMHDSRLAVEQTVGIKPNVLKAVLPLHPMAALLLKNISSAFASNQRSMFDFIKNPDMGEVKSFQWFINEFGPLDDQPLLTIDMLWSFFYEKGRENLSSDIRSVLDTYPRYEKQLSTEERRVLKTILMMQAISQRMGDSVELFQTTEKNINLAFDGTDLETNRAVNIAKKLVRDEILYNKPLAGGKTQFASATTAGDQAQIDKIKERLRKEKKTASLVDEGELATVLSLNPALRLRYEITCVTADDFTRVINGLREKPTAWRLRAVIGFAKNDTEAVTLRKLMKQAATDESYDMLFLDATSVPLGLEGFEQYVDYVANSEYQRKKDNHLADEMARRAKDILRDWKNRVYNGQFVVYSYAYQSGEMLPNGLAIQNALMSVSLKKYPLGFDAAEVTETMFTPSNLKQGVECG